MNVSRCVSRSLKRGLRILAVFAASLGFLAPVSAQVPPNFDLPSLLQRAQEGQSDTVQQGNSGVQTYMPVNPVPIITPRSRLEQIYSERAGTDLKQFGYDTLGVPMTVQVAQAGATQDSYVLGIGDQVVVVLRGQENSTYSQRIDRNGQIILPKLPPIPAAGRRFGEFRADLEARVAQAFVQTNAFVSLAEIRQVSILVAGEVRSPGVRILSALSSPLDAILLSGGVNKAGSLRSITVENGGQIRTIDLYTVLTGKGSTSLGTLHDGDKIYVPPIGNTFAVAGRVRRPGIYELPRGATAMSASDVVALAGGVEIAGAYQIFKTDLDASGRTQMVSLPPSGTAKSGEIIFVDVSRDVTTGSIVAHGALRISGPRPRASASTVGQLIPGVEDLTPDAYPMFAVIVRRDPRSNVKVLDPFSLERVFAKQGDIALLDYDEVYVFTTAEARLLAKAASGQVLTPGELGVPEACSKFERTIGSLTPTPVNSAAMNAAVAQAAAAAQGGSTGGAQSQAPLLALTATNAPAAQLTNLPVQQQMDTACQAYGTLTSAQNAAARSALSAGVSPQTYANLTSGSAAGNNQNYPGATGQGAAEMALGASASPSLTNNGGAQTSATTYSAVTPASPLPPAPTILEMTQNLGVSADALINVAKDHVVWVADSVNDPGPYLGADGSTIESMIQAAGGLSREADLSSVEVTSTQIDAATGSARTLRSAYKATEADLRRVAILPLDVIRLRPVFSDSTNGRITVDGEVRYPGTFDIVRGEKLSSVLERAGGLTAEAYPYGAVFTRTRAADEARVGNVREAKQLEADFATLISMPTYAAAAQGAAPYITLMAQQLRDQPTLGRITITADPAILRTRPELDIAVEPGDKIVIPRRPTTVTVSGEVLNPGSFQFRGDLSLKDYLTLSGGATQASDESRIFVVLPDGTARPASQSWLSVNSTAIPPGATIVVPRDLSPFDTTQFLKDISQIGSQLAITAASLAVIGNN